MEKLFKHEFFKWALSAVIGVIAINFYYSSKKALDTTISNIEYFKAVRRIDSIQTVNIVDIKREYTSKKELYKLDSMRTVNLNITLKDIQTTISNNNTLLKELKSDMELQKECTERMKGAWAAKGVDLTFMDTFQLKYKNIFIYK